MKVELTIVDSAMLRTFARLDELEEEYGSCYNEVEELVNGGDFSWFCQRFANDHGFLLQSIRKDYKEMKKDWTIVYNAYMELDCNLWWALVDDALDFHYGR